MENENKNQVCFCIPARYKSTRLVKKLLLKFNNKTMIQLTCEQVLKTLSARQDSLHSQSQIENPSIYVLTDHSDIANHISKVFHNKIKIIMTSENCKNGSERISKYLDQIPSQYNIIVNIQADEPFIDPRNIDHAITTYLNLPKPIDKKLFYLTLHQPTTDPEYLKSTGCVKVVVNFNHEVLYYTRAIVPWNKKGVILTQSSQQIYNAFTGIYVFNRKHLEIFHQLENTPLQLIEDIEQLKILEHGFRILSFPTPFYNEISVNTPEDLDYIKNKYTL